MGPQPGKCCSKLPKNYPTFNILSICPLKVPWNLEKAVYSSTTQRRLWLCEMILVTLQCARVKLMYILCSNFFLVLHFVDGPWAHIEALKWGVVCLLNNVTLQSYWSIKFKSLNIFPTLLNWSVAISHNKAAFFFLFFGLENDSSY